MRHAAVPPTEAVYDAMLAEATRVGLPKTFLTDLTVHDRRFVATHPDASFVWMLYQHGTHIVTLGPRSATTLRLVCVGMGEVRLYWVSPAALEAVSLDEALDRIEPNLRGPR